MEEKCYAALGEREEEDDPEMKKKLKNNRGQRKEQCEEPAALQEDAEEEEAGEGDLRVGGPSWKTLSQRSKEGEVRRKEVKVMIPKRL